MSSDAQVTASGVLRAVLKAEAETDGVRIVASPMFVLADGERSRITDGDELRVAQRSVSPEGTVTTTGFERIQTGLDVSVAVRDLGAGRARLDVDTSVSQVVGYVEDLPQLNRQSYKTAAWVESGGVYLLGSMNRTDAIASITGILQLSERQESEARSVQIWAKAFRIRYAND